VTISSGEPLKKLSWQTDSLPLKDALIGAGYMAVAAPGRGPAGGGPVRKIMVEIKTDVSYTPRMSVKCSLFFNGKEVPISTEGYNNLAEHYLFRPALNKSLNGKVNITRMRQDRVTPADILGEMAEVLSTTEKSELLINLYAAIESMENVPAGVTARVILAYMSPTEAEAFTGIPALDLIEAGYGSDNGSA
jgi:hypothetical protein